MTTQQEGEQKNDEGVLSLCLSSVVVNEFESATLECTAKGSPEPRIEWRRADNAVLPTGGIIYRGNKLKIHSVKKEDRGTYFCVADNKVGKAAKRHISLEVEFAPHIVDEKENHIVPQALGFEVGLTCSVEAFPPATITWIHQGIQVRIIKLSSTCKQFSCFYRNQTTRRTCLYTEAQGQMATPPLT